MSIFKIQKIRSCITCGDLLSLKCKGCTAHPNRKPRVIEFYDWPEILETGPCGCIKIRCQALGCVKIMWRDPKHYAAGGKAISKRFFCTVRCSALSLASARCTRSTVPCAYCTKPVEKKSFALKTWSKSFCNRTCYFLQRAKAKHDAKEAAKKQRDATDRALLYCAKCKDVEEHVSTAREATCIVCGSRRGQSATACDAGETQRLVNANRDARYRTMA